MGTPLRNPTTARPAWQRDANGTLPALLVAVLIVFMVVPEGFDYQALGDVGAPTAGSAVSRLVWLALLGASAAIIVWRSSLATRLAGSLNVFLPLFVVLALASVGWSIDPGLSARRTYRLVTIVFVCIAAVLVGWHAQRLQQLVRPVLTLLLVGSLAFGLTLPVLAIHDETSPELAGAWHGLANHKNSLGALAGMGLLFWIHAALSRERTGLIALAGIAVAGACLVLSRSSTSMVAAACGALFLLLALRATPGVRVWMPALVVGAAVALMVFALALLDLIPGSGTLMAPIAALTDKDTSFTGRTQIWALLTEHIQLRPVLGSGYGAYWTAGPVAGTEAYEFVRRMAEFYPGSAHNGYFEVLNDLGWVGLAVLVGYIAVHVAQSLRLLRVEYTQAMLYLALFFQQLITNLSETHWFGVQSVDFVLMTLASTALARALLQQRFIAAYGAPTAVRASPSGIVTTGRARALR